jgi:four helix bundle protein
MKRKHRELPVWQASIELVEAVYALTDQFPTDERFGLTQQLRRAAVSAASNLAEGAARKTTTELIQFLHISSGSLAEIDTQLEIAKRLGYGNAACDAVQTRLDDVHRQLVLLIDSLKRRSR